MNKQYQQMRRLYERGHIDEKRYAQISMKSYYDNPDSFSEDQVEQFYQFAKERNIPFEKDPAAQENALVGAMNQLASGVVEGFTTFGWAEDPDTQTEAILNKVGHLVGFAPDIIAGVFTFGASLPGSVAKKSAFRAARLKAGERVKEGLGDFGQKYIPALTRTDQAGGLQLRSIPMKAADWVVEQGKSRLGGAEFLRNNFIGKKLAQYPELLEIMEESAHLGIAMAVSARKDGPEGWAESAQHGAMAGAFFGGVRNYVNLGTMLASRNRAQVKMAESKIKEIADDAVGPQIQTLGKTSRGIDYDRAQYIDFITRGTLGSAFTGGQASMQNAPFADQVYEYLLGFFFGAAGRPKFEQRATQALVENMVGKKGEPDKILTVVQEGQNMIINGAYITKMQWYKDLGPKEKRYVDAFQADLVLDQINRIGNNQGDVVLEAIKTKLDAMGDIGIETLSKREKIRVFLEANKQAKLDLIVKEKDFIEAKQKDLAERPDIDLSNAKQGDVIDLYTMDGKTEAVTVERVSDGKVFVKGAGKDVVEVNQQSYFTKNVFNPEFRLPNSEFIPEQFRNKKLNELSNEQKTEIQEHLRVELTKVVNKANQIPGEYDRIASNYKAAKIESIRANEIKTDSERSALDILLKPEQETQPEATRDNNNQSRVEDPNLTKSVNRARELLEEISKDVPELNPVETRKVLKLLARKSVNRKEFIDGVAEYVKQKKAEMTPDSFQRLRKLFIDAKGTKAPLNKIWFEYSGLKERQSLTVLKTIGEGGKVNYTLIETPTTDAYNKPLRMIREETYHNTAIEGSKPLDIKIDYIRTTNKEGKQSEFESTSSKIGVDPYFSTFNVTKDIYNIGSELKAQDRYIHHLNPSNNEINARRHAWSKDPNSQRYLPEADPILDFIETQFNMFKKKGIKNESFFDSLRTDKNGEKTPFGEMYETKADYKKELLSNMLYEFQDAGLLPRNKNGSVFTIDAKAFKDAYFAYKKNPLFANVIKWTQYRKVLENGASMSFDTSAYGPEGIKSIIIKDSSGVFGVSDGQKYYSERLRADVLNEAGRGLEEGYIKDVLVTDPVYNSNLGKSRGMVFNKSAEQATHKGIYKLMKDLGVDIIIVESSNKSNSRHQMAEVEYDAKADSYKLTKKGETFNVQSRDIKLIKSEGEVSNTRFQRLPFGSIMMRNITFGPEFNRAMEDLFMKQLEGDKGYNTEVMNLDMNTIDVNKPLIMKDGRPLDLDRMSIDKVVELFNTNIDTPLGTKLIESLFEKDGTIKERFESEVVDNDVSLRAVNDLLKQFNYNPIILRIGNNHKYVEQALKNYIHTRLSRPRIDYGNTYVRMKAADPMLLSKINLTDSNFFLHSGHKSDKVNLKKANGKDYTLEEAFNELQEYRARKNPTETDKNRIKQLEDAINYVIVRSPVGNPSGVLSLDFGGFVDIAGLGIIMSKKNVKRAGGADFDGDAVAMYQSVPQAIKKTFKSKEIVDLLSDKSLTRERPELGFKAPGEPALWKDVPNIFSPFARHQQAAEVVKVGKMIGQVTNLNQFIREHLNYAIQGDGRIRLNNSNDAYLVPKGDPVELLRKFESEDAPNILNLTLDGAKNAKNPNIQDLQAKLMEMYFTIEAPSLKIRGDMINIVPDRTVNGVPIGPDFSALHRQNKQIFEMNRSDFLENITSQEKSGFYENSSNIFINKEVRIIRKSESADYLATKLELETAEKLYKETNDPADYAAFKRIQKRLNEFGVIEKDAEGNSVLPVFKNVNADNMVVSFEQGTRTDVVLKDVAYVNVDLKVFDAFGARRNFLNALKQGVGENGSKIDIGSVSQIAERFVEHYSYNRQNGRRYTDSLINIAEKFGTDTFNMENISLNIKPINDATFRDYTINILKALDKVKSSETMTYLRRQGILDEQLLAFTSAIRPEIKSILNQPTANIREIFDKYSSFLTEKNAKKINGYDQGFLTEQVMKMTGLLNFEVQASKVREYLKTIGVPEKIAGEKMAEIIDMAYKLKLADLVKEKSYLDVEPIKFDLDSAINQYRAERLNKIRVDGKLKTLNPEITEVLSEMFSNALMSNIFTTRKKVVSYFNRIKNRDADFLNDYGLDLSMLGEKALKSLDVNIASAEGNYSAKLLDFNSKLENRSINDIPTDTVAKLFDHARRIEVSRPNMLKSDAIPNNHKQQFLLGMQDIVTKGETLNRKIVVLDTSNIKSPISNVGTRRPAEKITEKTPVRTLAEKIAAETVERTVADVRTDKIKKVKIESLLEKDKDFVIAENESQAQLLENIFNMTETDIVESAKKLIEVEYNQMNEKQKYEYLEEGSIPIEMKTLESGKIVKNKTLITEAQEFEVKRLLDAIEKNPDIAVAIEGDFTMFSKMVGLTGLPEVGKTFNRMQLSDLRFFNNYVQDVYLSRDSMVGKLKKFGAKIGKNVFGNKYWSKKENFKSPIDKMMHYYFQQADTIGAGKTLRAKEMLQVYQENVPVIDKVDGEYKITSRSLTRPLSTLEIVRQQVEFGNTFASTMQDYFEDILKDSFDVFNTGDKRLQAEKDLLIEAAINKRIYDNGSFGGLRLQEHIKVDFRESWERSKAQLRRMDSEHKEFRILDETSGKGNERKVKPEEMIDIVNERITDFYDLFVKNIYNVNTVTDKAGNVKLTDNAIQRVLTNGFLDVNKVQRLMKDMKMGTKSKVDLMENLIGMNELMYYKYEYELIRSIQNLRDVNGNKIYPEFDPKKPSTITPEILREANAIRQFTKPELVRLQLDSNGRPSNYWNFTNHNQFKANKKNIDNHISKLMVEATKKVRDMSPEQLPPHIKALFKAKAEGYGSILEAKGRFLSEIRDHLAISMQRMRNENAGMADNMTQLVGGNRGQVVGPFMAGHLKSKGQDIMPGFGKDLNVLGRYVKAASKSYIDTLTGLRSTMLIDTFKKTNALKDVDATEAWTGYMRESLQNMMGMASMRNFELAGITKAEKGLLQAYIDAGLDKQKIKNKIGNNYRRKQFLRDLDAYIAPDSYWYKRMGDNLTGSELRNAIQDYRINAAKKLNDVKNINKINRFGTLYHLTSDAAGVNAIRSVEERVGKFLGYKEGEFSIFGDLRMVKDPITGEMRKVSEEAKRVAIQRKLKKLGDFEGKWELLSLLSHPKTAITNILGGSQNIYADTGWKPFRQAMSEDYLINTVFKGATYKTKNPRTGEIIEKKFESFRDIETWLSQEGFLEGMYIEQAGINKTFRDADMNKAAKEIINKLFTSKNKELLDSNPTEFDKIRKATIREIGEKYGVFDALVKFGSTFMSATEIKLRRTAALAHYLNARDVMMPLTSELAYNSPMLMHIARKGIESSQFIYHSAFRTNYANTSLGRVMTRFHPYAWNSVKRRRLLYKGARYTEWSNTTNSSKVFQRQMTADLMSMALASIFTSTIFEYSLSPPMSWMQDTAQWLFGDEKERERAFFSQWPTTAFAPLQIVTPPIARYVLPPINAIASGDFDSLVKFQLATFAPFGRLGRDIYRSYQSPSMSVDFLTGIPIHRMGQHIKKQRQKVEEEQELRENIANSE